MNLFKWIEKSLRPSFILSKNVLNIFKTTYDSTIRIIGKKNESDELILSVPYNI